jgi:hypothetical protein
MDYLHFFIKGGAENVYNENGNEAIDIVDEEGDHIAANQLVNLEMYLKKKVL